MGGGTYGQSYSDYTISKRTFDKEIRSEEIKEGLAKRKKVEEMVDEMIEQINLKVIRPGPKPEERVCTEVAEELKQMRSELATLAYKHIKKL